MGVVDSASTSEFQLRPSSNILCHLDVSSKGLGWSHLNASAQSFEAYETSFDAIDDHLICVHRDGPAQVDRRLSGDVLSRTIYPGELFILPANRDFDVRLHKPLSSIHLFVNNSTIQEVAAEVVAGDPAKIEVLPHMGKRDELMEHLAYTVFDLMFNEAPDGIAIDSISHMVALQLVRNHSSAKLQTLPDACGLSKRQLRMVVAYIESHIEQRILLKQLADVVGLSTTHFSRQFKRTTGRSPHKYLMDRRISVAKSFLRGEMSIAEIAYRCGFSHQEHLTNMFQKYVGLTPGAYRRAR